MRKSRDAEEEQSLRNTGLSVVTLAVVLACLVVVTPCPSAAIEEGAAAPGFTLPATSGTDVSLSDFKGKKWVFLEFYGSDFAPTGTANLTARKADYKRFEDLGIQILAVSANTTFSQQTFAESLKLPYPLLSDFPDRKVIRAYGILNDRTMTANRTFFLIDPQGTIRKRWIVENGATTVVYSDTLLRDIRAVMQKP